MVAPARELTDEQAVADVVAYITTLEADAPPRTEMTGNPEAGQELFRDCTRCHGTKGQGVRIIAKPVSSSNSIARANCSNTRPRFASSFIIE